MFDLTETPAPQADYTLGASQRNVDLLFGLLVDVESTHQSPLQRGLAAECKAWLQGQVATSDNARREEAAAKERTRIGEQALARARDGVVELEGKKFKLMPVAEDKPVTTAPVSAEPAAPAAEAPAGAVAVERAAA